MTGPGALVAGRYRLRSQLGGGGMGAVWLARDELLGRDVAVKQVLVPVGIDAALAQANRDAAMREGRIAARLSHPHAVAVYDMVLDAGQPWLVMEYLASVSLAALLHERGVLPITEVAQIGAQVADALTATHAAGVVHRDVKPGNILIGAGPGREGLVKITDFGISRAVGDVSLTQTGVVKGTPAFLAPEVAQGSPPDEASDVFSLGATLYACLEGAPPFGLSDNALQMLHKVAGGEFPPPRQAGALTSPLLRMLSADPAARPTMPQVRDELARLAAGPDRDVTEVLTARTVLPRTLPGMPAPHGTAGGTAGGKVPIAPPTPVPAAPAPATPAPARPSGTAQPPPTREPAAAELPASAPASAAAPVPSPPAGPAPRVAGEPAPAPVTAPRRRRWAALSAVLVLALAAALLVVWLRPDDDPGDASGRAPESSPAATTPGSTAPDSTAPSTDRPEDSTPAASAPATTPETSEPPAPAGDAPSAAELERFVTDYYALLPGDPDAAYARTGPTLRGISGPADYAGFWSRYRAVTLGAVQADPDALVVDARVTFVETDGDTFPERHRIQLVRGADGRLLVDSDVAV